jgi:hypothetical protein
MRRERKKMLGCALCHVTSHAAGHATNELPSDDENKQTMTQRQRECKERERERRDAQREKEKAKRENEKETRERKTFEFQMMGCLFLNATLWAICF